jgi:hypothetical protein
LVLSDLTSQELHRKLQTRFIVREGALQEEEKAIVITEKNLAMGSKGEPDTKTNWSTDLRP